MPALVCTFRNIQRGFTRKVSSWVTFKLSLAGMGAFLPTRSCAAASAASKALRPAKALAITDRREIGMTNLLYPGREMRSKCYARASPLKSLRDLGVRSQESEVRRSQD